MPSLVSISLRIWSVQGSAPNTPTFKFILSLRPDFSKDSAKYNAYEGVQASAVACKSCIISICFSVLPAEIGIVIAPIVSQAPCAPRPPVNNP